MTTRRKQELWTVTVYAGVTLALTATFWLDPLHDGWSKQALYYGPMFGIMTIAIVELFFWFETIIFSRDILSEWFDKHVGTWSEPPSAGLSNKNNPSHASGLVGMNGKGETETQESQDQLAKVN